MPTEYESICCNELQPYHAKVTHRVETVLLQSWHRLQQNAFGVQILKWLIINVNEWSLSQQLFKLMR